MELLHGGIAWICNSGAVFSELELYQTRPYCDVLEEENP
jgi:hypothetical protein